MTTATTVVANVRLALGDPGFLTTDTIALDGTTTYWQLSNSPIVTGSDSITDNSLVKVRTNDYTINVESGLLSLLYATTTGHTVLAQYTSVFLSDEVILAAIGDAVRAMYPYVYKTGECYVAGAAQQYQYDLTSTTDVPIQTSFASGIVPSEYVAATARTDLAQPQTRIHRAEYLRDGTAGQTSWRSFQNFTRTTPYALSTDAAMISGDVLKLIYSAPCTPPTASTSTMDVPDAYSALPVWYAIGQLHERLESVRTRFQGLLPQGYGVVSLPPGAQMSTGQAYMKLFYDTLQRNPMRPMSTEIRKRVPNFLRTNP